MIVRGVVRSVRHRRHLAFHREHIAECGDFGYPLAPSQMLSLNDASRMPRGRCGDGKLNDRAVVPGHAG
jgi:hypothetical protein